MTITIIPFVLNHKSGILEVHYQPNERIEDSGFDLLAGFGFDVNLSIGYPTMHGFVSTYQGSGYYTASAWIQIITRKEFVSAESVLPRAEVASVDVNPSLYELGVPFFAMGFPAEIFDAPCCNLGDAGKLTWIADTFYVTMPSRINDNKIVWIAGYQWGYIEYDQEEKRPVEILPLSVTDEATWQQHLPLLRRQFGKWKFS
jgi:hypothetical protein